MSSLKMKIVKVLQAIIIIVTLHLEAGLFMGASCWRIRDANGSCVEKERKALVNMKNAFVDQYGRLSSWGSSTDCCQWIGVLCHPQSGHVETLILQADPEPIWKPLRGEISPSLIEFQHLNHLNLGYNDFSGSHIPKYFGSLTKLTYLDLYGSAFGGKIPIELGKLSHLRILNLSNNRLVGSIPFQLANLSSLQDLCLDYNYLVGNIPSQLGNLSRLEKLWLGNNDALKIDDKSPVGIEWLSNLGSLISLHLSNVSNLNYSKNLLPIIEKLSNLRYLRLRNCSLTDINILSTAPSHLNFSASLVTLDLGGNMLTSSIFPLLSNLSSNLANLYLDKNNLGGPIPDDFARNMNSLEDLDLSDNELNGTISDIHFGNLTKLQFLHLSYNLLSLKFSNHWIPPFQLQDLMLYECKLGPGFPRWLRTQKHLQFLHISNAEINDSIPEWFWKAIGQASILQIESSNLKGNIPDLPLESTSLVILLGSNQIEGSLPLFLLKSKFLDISENQISKFSLSCGKGISAIAQNLEVLDLSNNSLLGKLPDCWDHFKLLKILDLSNNQLSGRIPNSMGSLSQLEKLALGNNCFSGRLPSLENATKLGMLDLERNNLSGPIPLLWTRDNLKDLETLSLRMNNLDGKLPFHLCYLTKVRILNLSFNKFSGPIPSCLDKLVAMTQKHFRNDSIHWISFFKKGNIVASMFTKWDLPMVWKEENGSTEITMGF